MLWSPFSFVRAKRALEKGDHNMGTFQELCYLSKGVLGHLPYKGSC